MITLENYEEFLPILKESIVVDDDSIKEEILFQIKDFEILIKMDSKKEICLMEIDEFFKSINYWIEIGLIYINDLDQKKTFNFRATTKPTYPTKNNIPAKPVHIGYSGGDLSRFGIMNNSYDLLNDQEPPEKKNDKIDEDIKPTYQLNQKDDRILKELDLPESKLYLYKEIRKQFGRPVKPEILAQYGINRFARNMMSEYPHGFRITEIKNILNLVLTYDKFA